MRRKTINNSHNKIFYLEDTIMSLFGTGFKIEYPGMPKKKSFMDRLTFIVDGIGEVHSNMKSIDNTLNEFNGVNDEKRKEQERKTIYIKHL